MRVCDVIKAREISKKEAVIFFLMSTKEIPSIWKIIKFKNDRRYVNSVKL